VMSRPSDTTVPSISMAGNFGSDIRCIRPKDVFLTISTSKVNFFVSDLTRSPMWFQRPPGGSLKYSLISIGVLLPDEAALLWMATSRAAAIRVSTELSYAFFPFLSKRCPTRRLMLAQIRNSPARLKILLTLPFINVKITHSYAHFYKGGPCVRK
jgi:hypothetical protein